MPFTFKLSQRLARMRTGALLASVALIVAAVACERIMAPTSPASSPVQIVVVPESITLDVTQQNQFVAYGRRFNGDSASVAVTWAASGGTITPAGMYTAGSIAGTFQVTAATPQSSVSGSSSVHVRQKVGSVTVSPAAASVQTGQTVQLTATALDVNGNPLTGWTFSWASSSTAVATVTGSGLVTGVVAGSATITATAGGKSGTAAITVTTVPVASVTVTPATASVAVGQTVQLVATPLDASGNPLSGRVITWASNATSATVNVSGLVSGVAAGVDQITATSEGKSGSATVTVTVPAGAPECANPQPAWIWCDDFEQNRLGQYFEYDSSNGAFVRAAGVGLNGSYGMRVHFTAGQVSAGSLHLAMGKVPYSYFRTVDAGTAIYRDVYWRMYVRNQTNWVGGAGYKLSRAISFATSTWAEAMIAHLWGGDAPDTNYLQLDPASGTDTLGNLLTTTYNDFAHIRWLGRAVGVTPLFDVSHVGPWYCVEAHAKLNDAGLSNGVFEFWINGNLQAQRTGLNWVGSFSAYGMNAVFFENYWNTGSPVAQERYFDNIVISTQRIGC